MASTRHVPPRQNGQRRVVGIDLGGARVNTTGYAVLDGKRKPMLVALGLLGKSKSADLAERDLLAFLEECEPDLIAVDAPLTLPPCLECPSFCRGPGAGLCELKAAEAVWAAGGHPVTERLCEVRLREELPAGPLPTMRIGQIAARGVALARRLKANNAGTLARAELVEVYPFATMHRWKSVDPLLGPRRKGETEQAFAERMLGSLAQLVGGIDGWSATVGVHAVDALVAARTGWLSPDELERVPEDFNAGSGWISLPSV